MRLEHALILLWAIHAEVIEQSAALGDHAEKPSTSRLVLFVLLEVLCEQLDLLGQDCDLDLR